MLSRQKIREECQNALDNFGDLYDTYVASYGTYRYDAATGKNVLVSSFEHEFKAIYTRPSIFTVSQSGDRIQIKDLFLVGMYEDILTNPFDGRGIRIGDKVTFPNGNVWEVIDIVWDMAEATATIQVR